MSALPWRPIAEFPVCPPCDSEFLLIDSDRECEAIVVWKSDGTLWETEYEYCTDSALREDYTHFIEITPPGAAPTR